MSYADAEVRPLLDLEGLKAWQHGRTVGLRAARARPSTRAASTTTTGRHHAPATIDLDGPRARSTAAHLLLERALAGSPPGAGSRCAGRRSGAGRRTSRRGAAAQRAPASRPRRRRWSYGRRRSRPLGRRRARRRRRRPVASSIGPTRPGGSPPAARWSRPGGPALRFDLDDRDLVWADIAPRLYAQAAASQWDPATAIDVGRRRRASGRGRGGGRPGDDVPGRERAGGADRAGALPRPHPSALPRGVQLLAVQVADEARHVEVFTRRRALRGGPLGVSTAGGRASLQTLLDEPDFAAGVVPALRARRGDVPQPARVPRRPRARPRHPTGHAPRAARTKPATSRSASRTWSTSVELDPGLRGRLRAAVERRHDALRRHGRPEPGRVRRAGRARRRRLDTRGDRAPVIERSQALHGRHGRGPPAPARAPRLPADEAAALSALHTRNFM